MADKKELADLLSGLSEEELFNLANIISKATTKKPRNKKRAVKKTAKKKVVKKKEQSDFMHSLRLNPQEKAELKSAEKFDKEKGLDHYNIWCIDEDLNGNLWVSTIDGKLLLVSSLVLLPTLLELFRSSVTTPEKNLDFTSILMKK